MNDITHYDDDDGFGGSVINDRLIKGTLLRWTAEKNWFDRDGLEPPKLLIVLGCAEAVQRWLKNESRFQTIKTRPLPDVKTLNGAIAESEWELGSNNQPKPPWSHQYVAYLIDPATAAFFTHLNSTFGTKIAWDLLRERVITMRALRGQRVHPLVKLGRGLFRTRFGTKPHPDFPIVGWKSPGGDGGGAISGPETPQIAGPATAQGKAETKPQTKPEVPATGEAAKTIDTLGEVKLPTAAEELADEIPW